ncbi:MAG: Ppx/GppA family phosphatase [Alphaproteobacteria bacterium]|nr:MAG: Ppx/GppA family phosphatase [Alphaproteobacteria bacterium]
MLGGPERIRVTENKSDFCEGRDGSLRSEGNGEGSASGFRSDLHKESQRGRWRHTYAAIDLGTNNCRLLVAKPKRDGFRVIDAFSRTVRLGEGLDETGYLSEGAMERALAALHICAAKIRKRGVTRTRAIATEACRMAGNGLQFVDQVAKKTGLQLDIIPADEEARLAVAGCSSLLDDTYDAAVIFDIGGGSTEIVWLDLRQMNRDSKLDNNNKGIIAWISLPFGVVNLAERFGVHDISPHTFEAMVSEVRELLEGFEEAEGLRSAFQSGRAHLLGTSGTVTTLAGIYLGLAKYDRPQVDGTWASMAEVRAIARRLAKMSHEQRVQEPCIGKERADFVVAGCAILEAICQMWPCERLRIADRGLREGMLLTLMEKADRERPRRFRNGRRKRQAKSMAASPAADSRT